MKANEVQCIFCGSIAHKKDRYLSPFRDDKSFFCGNMSIYFCSKEHIGFVYPSPGRRELDIYYKKIYRLKNKEWNQDYRHDSLLVTQDHLSKSQLMYISMFVDMGTIERVIDLGCGYGDFLAEVKKIYPNINAVGIDLDSSASKRLKQLNIGFLNQSIEHDVNEIAGLVTNNTLLVSSHALHFQLSYSYLNDLFERISTNGKKGVYMFIEIPNSNIDSELFFHRVYDVPQLTYYTTTGLMNCFNALPMNISTNGWLIDQEYLYRENEVKKAGRGKVNRICFESLKRIIPAGVKLRLKGILGYSEDIDHILSYYSYGGNRRALRMIAQVS